MTSASGPSAPLEAHDPDRARALKAKIRDRVSDVRRHLIALRTAMAEFGEDFDLDEFRAAYDTDVAQAARSRVRHRLCRAGPRGRAARIVADDFVPFYDAYRRWIASGFSATPPN